MALSSRKFPTDQGACDPGESARVPLKEKKKVPMEAEMCLQGAEMLYRHVICST